MSLIEERLHAQAMTMNGTPPVRSKEAKLVMKFLSNRRAIHGAACAGLLALASGCITPGQVSNRIVTAPNVQDPASSTLAIDWVERFHMKQNPFRLFNVPVGPPEAVLAVMELPPADYGLQIVSMVTTQKNGHGDFVLTLAPPTNAVARPVAERGTVVVLHGYGLEKEIMVPWAFVLAKAGYRVALVDLRGHGRSTGDTFSCGKYEVPDLVQALDYLQKQPGHEGKIGVLGLSLGADLALLWAARDPRVETVVAIAPYDNPDEALARFARAMKIPVSAGTLHEGMRVSAARLDLKWSDLSGQYAMRHLARPVLLIGGGRDTISPPGDLKVLEGLAPPGSKRIMIANADHFVIGFWFHELEKPVVNWFAEHLPAPANAKQLGADLGSGRSAGN